MTSTASRCLNRAKVCSCASHAPCYCHPSPGAIQSSAMAPDEFVAAAAKLVQRRPPGEWEADGRTRSPPLTSAPRAPGGRVTNERSSSTCSKACLGPPPGCQLPARVHRSQDCPSSRRGDPRWDGHLWGAGRRTGRATMLACCVSPVCALRHRS
jgi:hypothetical protein